jgi:hypothetical protein
MSDLHWTGGAAALVDHELSDAIFFMREGSVDPGRFTSPRAGTARLTVGQGGSDHQAYELPIVRNRHGLSLLEWRIPISDCDRLTVHPIDYFGMVRLDLIEVADEASDERDGPKFAWRRGDDRGLLQLDGVRWVTTQIMAAEGTSTLTFVLPEPETSRQMRITIGGAFMPVSDAPDGYLTPDPDARIAALQTEIEAIYDTRLLKAAAIPRRVYGALRRFRSHAPR